MNNHHIRLAALSLAAMLLATHARAVSFVNVDADNVHTTPGWVGYWNWSFGDDAFMTPNLPAGTQIAPDAPLHIDLELTHSLTAVSAPYWPTSGFFSFAGYSLNPALAPGDTTPQVSTYLTLNGTPTTGLISYSYVTAGPMASFAFAGNFDGLGGAQFNGIHITLTSPVERTIGGFGVILAVKPVPDGSGSAALLVLGLVAIGRWRKWAGRGASTPGRG